MRALAFLLLAWAGCDEAPVGACKATERCATAACAQFPTTNGCTFTPPVNGRCPLDHPQCFDPATAVGYCDLARAVCAKPRKPAPASCPPRLCTTGDVAVCNEVGDGSFCMGEFRCLPYGCVGDGGAPIEDAATDGPRG